ncbi:vitamin K epoxide reductase family protein [Patescibacteria group bacterium]|nr:vitamin K epoxide reductase family protein [Patescibacteria group bacterium]
MKAIQIIWARRFILWSALLGVLASAYLFYTYATSSDIKCGILHGCELVRVSKWATFFGIPTPTFGLIFYFSIIAVLIFRAYVPEYRPKILNYTQKILGVVGFTESLYLFGIQSFVIKSYCTWCLISALAASLVFILVWFDKLLILDKKQTDKEVQLYFWSLLAGAIITGLTIFLLV